MEPGELQGEPRSLPEVLAQATARLKRAGVQTPRLDAEVLLAEACRLSRAELLTRREPLSESESERFDAMLSRRGRREPLAYILGRKEFFSLDFEVNPQVLIPRPETETLAAAALDFLKARGEARVLDIGTGSGILAVTLAVSEPRARIVATDVSSGALKVARRNARRNRCAERIEFLRADLFPPGAERFDLVVSNPPYIEDQLIDALAPEVARFEPRTALAGGADGLDFYRRIGARARTRLNPDGALMVEIGAGQGAKVGEIFERSGLKVVAVLRDLAGIERVVHARA